MDVHVSIDFWLCLGSQLKQTLYNNISMRVCVRGRGERACALLRPSLLSTSNGLPPISTCKWPLLCLLRGLRPSQSKQKPFSVVLRIDKHRSRHLCAVFACSWLKGTLPTSSLLNGCLRGNKGVSGDVWHACLLFGAFSARA